MNRLHFTIPGHPVGKQRPRKGKSGRFYTPAKTQNYEKVVGVCGMTAKYSAGWPAGPSPDSFVLNYEIHHGTKRGRRPDADNVCKCLMDGLNGIVWVDDCQVIPRCVSVAKGDERPRVVVTIERLVQC